MMIKIGHSRRGVPIYGYSPDEFYLIYEFRNTKAHKSYIGCTTLSLKQRWDRHVAAIVRDLFPVHRAMLEDGLSVFEKRELMWLLGNKRTAMTAEQMFIHDLRTYSPLGYNWVCRRSPPGAIERENVLKCAMSARAAGRSCASVAGQKMGRGWRAADVLAPMGADRAAA